MGRAVNPALRKFNLPPPNLKTLIKKRDSYFEGGRMLNWM